MSVAAGEIRPAVTDTRLVPLPYLLVFGAAALGAGLGRAVTTSYLPVLLDRIEDAPGKIGTVMLVNAAAGLAVPLAVGFWSDRRAVRGGSRRLPFILGGSLVASGGLAALALGFSSSYLMLAAFGALVYVGLNAATTAHRALVPESFAAESRPRATSAQEIALLVGGLLGILVGGGLTGVAPWAPFAVAAVAVPALAMPTVSRTRESAVAAVAETSRPLGYYVSALRRPGVFSFLLAQVLWVLGYAALPAFFLLYAENVLGLEAASASLFLAGFGLATGAAVLAAGRVRDQSRLRPLLLLGISLMGGGFLLVSLVADLLLVGAALALVAVGFGLISTVGFPLFSSLIPEGEAGGYTALFFSVRAISSTIALPTAGWLIAVTGSYRSLFALGGLATLAALLPLSRETASAPRAALARLPGPRWLAVWTGALGLLALITLAFGRLIVATPLQQGDEELFRLVNRLGPGPEVLWTLLDPHTRNYLVLVALAGTIALLTRPARVFSVLARVLASALLAWGLLEAVYALYDRPRPEEVFGASEISLYGHSWARLESFPSGHMAITTALAVTLAFAFPRLRRVAWAYVLAVALTRVLFGAHFPFDTLAGIALGYGSALAIHALFRQVSLAPSMHPASGVALARESVVALMPTYGDVPSSELVKETLRHVGSLLIVDDGSPPESARGLERLSHKHGIQLLRLPVNRGKGEAIRAGLAEILAKQPTAKGVLVIDADGQHPPDAIPSLLEAAAEAELVIGDRFDDLGAMPPHRRAMNRLASAVLSLVTAAPVRDSQSGMRLLSGRALHEIPYPGGRYEAETRHLKRALQARIRVDWAPIPAIYGSERSSFRPLVDSYRIARAILGADGSPTPLRVRAPARAPHPPAHPTRSGLRGRFARGRPSQPDRAAAT